VMGISALVGAGFLCFIMACIICCMRKLYRKRLDMRSAEPRRVGRAQTDPLVPREFANQPSTSNQRNTPPPRPRNPPPQKPRNAPHKAGNSKMDNSNFDNLGVSAD